MRQAGTAISSFLAAMLAKQKAMFAPRQACPSIRLPADTPIKRAPNWLLLRLAVGLAQGGGILLLLLAHQRAIWPGSDPYLSTGLLLAGLMAPLALLEGLGQVETRLLLLWSGTLGFVIATLGVWLEWRGGIALIPVAGIAIFAVIAHITARAVLCHRPRRLHRAAWTETAWAVSTRLLVWGAVTALAFILISSLGGPFGWIKIMRFPLLGLVSAVGFTIADDAWLQRHTRSALPLCATIALPFLGAAALILLGLDAAGAHVSGASLLALATALALAIQACDRESLPGRWNKAVDGAVGAVILVLALAAGFILVAQVRTGGWTDARIFGAAAAALLGVCGLAMLATALPTPPTGLTVKPTEPKGPFIALLLAGLCLVLAVPLLAPLSSAVKTQMARLERDPPGLNFTWLNRQSRSAPATPVRLELRPAAPAVRAALVPAPPPNRPVSARPRLTGANINFHTEGEFAASLLTQDWSGQNVPRCLSQASAGCDAWFLDLDGDGQQEILLAEGDDAHFHGTVMKLQKDRWIAAAAFAAPPCRGLFSVMRRRGILVAQSQSRWRDLLVGGMRLTPTPAAAALPCPRF